MHKGYLVVLFIDLDLVGYFLFHHALRAIYLLIDVDDVVALVVEIPTRLTRQSIHNRLRTLEDRDLSLAQG